MNNNKCTEVSNIIFFNHFIVDITYTHGLPANQVCLYKHVLVDIQVDGDDVMNM